MQFAILKFDTFLSSFWLED